MARCRAFSFQKRLRIYWRDAFTCQYCGTPLHPLSEDLTLDHRDPKGGDDDANLATACRSCNSGKGTRTVAEALDRVLSRGTLLEALASRPISMRPEELIELVCRHWKITRGQLLARNRNRDLVRARAELAHMLRDIGWTYVAIAELLGKKDHSTIVHLLQTYPRLPVVNSVSNP